MTRSKNCLGVATQHYNTTYKGLIYLSAYKTYYTINATAAIACALGKPTLSAILLQAPEHVYHT